jgi:hypothetical protein
MQKISCLHALYQSQPVLGILTTAMDLVGIWVGSSSQKILNIKKAPTQGSYYLARRPTIVLSHTTKSQKDISTLHLTILQYLKYPQDLQDYITKILLNQQDPHGLLFILKCNYDWQPQMLPEISRGVQDYNMLLLINIKRIPREVNNSYHWNYCFSIFLFGNFELLCCQSWDYP